MKAVVMPQDHPQKIRAKRLIHTIGVGALVVYYALNVTVYLVQFLGERRSLQEADYYSAVFGRVILGIGLWWSWRIGVANWREYSSPSVGRDVQPPESAPGSTVAHDDSGKQSDVSSNSKGSVATDWGEHGIYTGILGGMVASHFYSLWFAPQTQTLHCYMLYIADLQQDMAADFIGFSSIVVLDVVLWICRRIWLQAPKDDSAGVQVS